MSDTLNLANSIWPNGMKVDPDGHAVFYPLGTNKVQVPTSASDWPKGDKLISPFVYDKDDKLVGFVDTKALTVSGSGTTTMNYSHIEADFASIYEGTLTVNAPNATVKKFRWAVSISGGDDNGIVTLKYKGCKTVDDVKAVDPNYQTTDIVDGVWSQRLDDLEDSDSMFLYCYNLTTFTSDLPNLTNGSTMFHSCTNLTSWNIDLPSLTNGHDMFNSCTNLTSWNIDLPSLTNVFRMFYGCSNLTSFNADLSSVTDGSNMF